MRIRSVHSWREDLALTRPYTIAFKTIDTAELFFVALETNEGLVGLGCASPGNEVTGEGSEECATALQASNMEWLEGEDPRQLGGLLRAVAHRTPGAPAARAALDMALHDLFAQVLGQPLVEVLGRCHSRLPTTITIGIKDVPATLEEAQEYLGRGFRALKVKTGRDLAEDLERLARLRELVGAEVTLRVDANQGWNRAQTLRFLDETGHLGLELVEQPLPAGEEEDLALLPQDHRRRIAADESLLDERDALALTGVPPPVGVFNIKLMKCGGVAPALRIAAIAEAAGVELMWGCMDESVISIAAALHAAFACPMTRYLDLDGSLDLARDVATGGFVLEQGRMRLTGQPGLGVTLL